MIASLIPDIMPLVAGLAAIFAALFAAYRKGAKDNDAKQTIKEAKANEKTHARIDVVPPVDPSDHDDITERLLRIKRGE
tara:strand:- start:1968 stop:2204 length:237 start_codon:yes stop_codon:yes gene_type:complete